MIMCADHVGCCLPSFTCEAGAFTLSGWLGPAASIGDTFYYSLARDVLHFSVTRRHGPRGCQRADRSHR